MTDARVPPVSRSIVLLVLLLAGLGALASAAPDWWTVTAEQSPTVTVAGGAAMGRGLALAVLAGSVLGWMLQGLGRRILGVVMALLGVGMAAAVLVEPLPSEFEVLTRLRQVSLASEYDLIREPWPWLYLVCAVLVVVAGVALAWWSMRWPGASRRFEQGEESRAGRRTAAVSDEPSLDLWRSLDDGEDPTDEDRRGD